MNRRVQGETLNRLVSDPLRTVFYSGIVALVAFFSGTLLPAFVAYHSGVFYKTQFWDTLHMRHIPVVVKYEQKYNYVNGLITLNEAQIERGISERNTVGISTLLTAHSYLMTERAKAESDLSIQPFFLNPLMYMWTSAYMSLGFLIFVLRQGDDALKSFTRFFNIAGVRAVIFPYLFFQGPVWLRNFVLTNEGRKVFNFANRDISLAAYVMQELNILLVFVLIGTLWQQSKEHLFDCRFVLKSLNGEDDLPKLSDLVTSEFLSWQVSSIILALGFIIFTDEYWSLLVGAGDLRYIVSAIAIHTTWGISWVILSLPLLTTWRAWHRTRQKTIRELYGIADDRAERRFALLQELSPVPFWNAIGSGIVAVGSFLLPLIAPHLK